MFICYSDLEGIVHKECVSLDQTVNTDFYLEAFCKVHVIECPLETTYPVVQQYVAAPPQQYDCLYLWL